MANQNNQGIKFSGNKNNSTSHKSKIGKWIFIIITILLLAFSAMIFAGILSILFGAISSSDDFYATSSDGNVALIKINGPILTETSSSLFSGSEGTSSTAIVNQLEKLAKDEKIKAIMFEINSPGGSGVAADEISLAIKSLGKPTVAYVRNIGTSAAYWIASSTDHVIANRLSLVGSIGVIASYLEFSGLLENYNVSYQRFVAGDYKDFGSPFREPTRTERELFQEQLNQIHHIFIAEIAENRNMSFEEVEELANGMFVTGLQGLDLGLIDDLGGKKEAIIYLEEQLGFNVNVVEYRKRTSLFDLFSASQQGRAYSIGRGIGDSLKASTSEGIII
ncbi:MAG: signal peptide peptidase SppA [Candidatus Woesearchaeota archaeon]